MPQNRGAEQHGDRDRGARQANPKGQERDQTTGQGTPGQTEPRGSERPTGQAPGDMKRDQKDNAKGRPAQSDERGQQTQRGRQDQQNQGAQGERNQQNRDAQRPQEQQREGAQRGQQPLDQTQGQGSHANISTEQRTRIRETIIKESNAPRVTNVNFNISVGTVVPRTVTLAPVPVTVIEIQPAWRGYVYFIVGDEIIIVEPGTHRIVAVIAA